MYLIQVIPNDFHILVTVEGEGKNSPHRAYTYLFIYFIYLFIYLFQDLYTCI